MPGPQKINLEPQIDLEDEEEEPTLPVLVEEAAPAPDAPAGAAEASGADVIVRYAKLAPPTPGVYRMVDARGDVLYVGKAKNIRKRILAYQRPTGPPARIARMIAATAEIEFVSTATETEALLLEANLIKRLRPRFNVLLRDDKSFPYILITGDHPAPQISKHRGGRSRRGDYFGPFASVWAVNRTITALERAFLIRSCSDAVFESRTRPCLLYQIKRCSGPCTGEVKPADYAELVREAKAFLSGKSRVVKEELAGEMEKASGALDFERAAIYRDRLAALSAVQAHQGINPRGIEEADVFAVHQDGGFCCVEVFFFRTGQNGGNRAYFPRADRSLSAEHVLGAFLSQFYDDKPCPRLILISHDVEDCRLIAQALTIKSGHKVEIVPPRRGEKKELVAHALANAREALARKLAETSSQQRLLAGLAETFGLPRPPRRIEVFDNSHIQGTNAVGAMIVAGPEGFRKNQYRKFNIRTAELAPGDDYGMMREVLRRRFRRLLAEAPKPQTPAPSPFVEEVEPHAPVTSPLVGEVEPAQPAREGGVFRDIESSNPLPIPPPQGGREQPGAAQGRTADQEIAESDDGADSPWPDLVLIDGGVRHLRAAREALGELGVRDVPVIAIAKGPDRDAGRETFFSAGREPFRLRRRHA